MEGEPITRDSNEKMDERRTGNSIRRGLVFAGLMIAVSLAAKYLAARGAIHSADLSLRLVMAIAGVFLMATGNMIPKTLTPLSAMRCDAKKVQSFQRMTGWTWVLAGLAVAIGWLVLPVTRAEQMMFVLLPAAIVLVAALYVRLLRTRPTGA
jgi:Ca2+/Na+ antiporter